jgi:hypothetical protein
MKMQRRLSVHKVVVADFAEQGFASLPQEVVMVDGLVSDMDGNHYTGIVHRAHLLALPLTGSRVVSPKETSQTLVGFGFAGSTQQDWKRCLFGLGHAEV